MTKLFRIESIKAQRSKYLGDIFLSTPLSYWVIIALITSMCVGFLCVAVFGEFARKERVSGRLVPSNGLVRIIPTQLGSYDRIDVETGDMVKAGDPLIKIKEDRFVSGGQELSGALLEQMKEERLSLEERLVEIPKQYGISLQRLVAQKADLMSEADRYTKQIDNQLRTVEIEKGILERFRSLRDQDGASVLELSSAENRYLQALQSLRTLENTQQNILANARDIGAQIKLVPVEKSQAELEVKTALASLQRSMLRTDAGGGTLIRAPVSGTIAAVLARKGQTISSQKVAISILPEGGTLQAELFVPTRAIGFAEVGQSVRLRYEAFPYQKFGVHYGQISDVSKTVLTGDDLSLNLSLAEPVFLLTVKLTNQELEAYGDSFPLQAGMTLSADLILEERKIWEWAFEPILLAWK